MITKGGKVVIKKKKYPQRQLFQLFGCVAAHMHATPVRPSIICVSG